MPSQAVVAVQNNFINGLVTEATGLNFPENACTETYNCVFNKIGDVTRREGFDFESGYTTHDINKTNAAINSYVWRNVGGNGDLNLVVTQIGSMLYFYEISSSGDPVSGAYVDSLDFSGYVAGSFLPELYDCQFADGNGLLFVTNPVCSPFYVSYNSTTKTVTGTTITIQIRDFEGDTADTSAVDARPTTTLAAMDVHHYYNLLNQGWTTTNLTAWDTSETTMPSNADIMYLFKNSSDVFDTATIPNYMGGNTPAPKGHYISNAFSINRDTLSGLTGTTATTLTDNRPGTCAFFTGRVFYSGVNASGYNTKIYFSQIVERTEQYGFCYQDEDPTSEDFADLLPSDGGVINILDAGSIIKLVSTALGLIVFASNGIWLIAGSTGIGFAANDYTVAKISSIKAISASSFVDLNGLPMWWNEEGIYTFTIDQNNPTVNSISYDKIKRFYQDIPSSSKSQAKGAFDPYTGIVTWLFRSTATTEIGQRYNYDRALNYNTFTKSFYPWTISASNTGSIKVNGIFTLNPTEIFNYLSTIVDSSGTTVVDSLGATVVSYSLDQTPQLPKFKYVTTYTTLTGQDKLTYSETNNSNYEDWYTYDSTGTDYTSYFIVGYSIRGQAIKKFQLGWLEVFSNTALSDVSYTVQGHWDFSNATTTGRWSSTQTLSHTDNTYDVSKKRVKIRGSGLALQLKFSSVTGSTFDFAGWSAYTNINQVP